MSSLHILEITFYSDLRNAPFKGKSYNMKQSSSNCAVARNSVS